MPRHSGQKLKLLYLSEILQKQTDEDHALTLNQIIAELQRYGISAERKSLYDDIEALRVFGIDVRVKRDRYVRYYAAEGKFNAAEQRLIRDLIMSCEIISEIKSRSIVNNLIDMGASKSLLADSERRTARSEKADNDDAYNNLEVICRAIDANRKILFKRFEWDARKQRILLDAGRYVSVSPWSLELDGGRYRMLAYDDQYKEMKYYRIDRMMSLSVSKQKREGESEFYDFHKTDREPINLRFRCDNSFAGEAFDRFGLEVTILANRDSYFEFATKVAVNDKFYSWLFENSESIALISPDNVVEEYRSCLEAALKR